MFKRFSVNGLRRSRACVLACDTSDSSQGRGNGAGQENGKEHDNRSSLVRVVAWVRAATLARVEVIDVTANRGYHCAPTSG